MALAALPALSATLALAATAAPQDPAPVVSRAPAHTVSTAIDRAEALGAITAGRADTYRLQWHDAYRTAKRAQGPRRVLVQQAVASARQLAAGGGLRAGRLASVIASAHASALAARSSAALP